MNSIEEKRIFLICSADLERAEAYAEFVRKHISNTVVFTSNDGSDVLFKMDNCPPNVLVIDNDLPKKSGIDVVTHILHNEKLKSTNIIITSPVPEKEYFVNEVVTGQVQFLVEPGNEKQFNHCVVKSLNRVSHGSQNEYGLKFLAPDDVLFREGDLAHSVFIVKRGELTAFKGSMDDPRTLGTIRPGEFVGEMAHINNEPRSATVKASSDCELIEIPRGSLDTVLFTKPAWAKALVSNLSKRLKSSNEALAKA